MNSEQHFVHRCPFEVLREHPRSIMSTYRVGLGICIELEVGKGITLDLFPDLKISKGINTITVGGTNRLGKMRIFPHKFESLQGPMSGMRIGFSTLVLHRNTGGIQVVLLLTELKKGRISNYFGP